MSKITTSGIRIARENGTSCWLYMTMPRVERYDGGVAIKVRVEGRGIDEPTDELCLSMSESEAIHLRLDLMPRDDEDKLIEEGMRHLRAAYYRTVRIIAEDIANRARNGAYKPERAHDSPTELMEADIGRMIDSNEWLIHTFKARIVCLVSDNQDEADDVGVTVVDSDGNLQYERVAGFAMLADVRDRVIAEGIDLDVLERCGYPEEPEAETEETDSP